MITEQIVNILLDSIGVLLMLVLLISTRHTAHNVAYDQRIYHQLLKYTLALNALDLLVSCMRPNEEMLARLIILLIATSLHVLQLLVSYKWVLYVDYRTHQSASRLHGTYGMLLVMPVVVIVGLLAVNLFNGMFFTIAADGSYHWTPAVGIVFLVAFVYAVYSAILPLLQRRSWRYYRSFPVAMYLVPVLLGNAAHLYLETISVSWVAMAVGFVSLQLSTENDISYMDPLTGLYNRHFLNQHLQNMFERMDDPESTRLLAGILIDLNEFKRLNDTHGHLMGDRALQEVGVILRESLPLDAVPCRFGGDEFVIIVPVDTREELPKIVDAIQKRTAIQNAQPDRVYELSMSIGWTIYAKNADTIDSFFGRMDEKMYREKAIAHGEAAE